MATCSNCTLPFKCNAETGNCWCGELPTILEGSNQLTCLCSSCLPIEIKNKIAHLINDFQITGINHATTFKELPVTHTYDYTIENHHWLFTSWYHLRRGSCCGNGCRNCPY